MKSSFSELLPQPWQRLWLPAHSWDEIPGIDDDFITGDGARNGADHLMENALPGIGTLKTFSTVPFLLLLGRPGSGKSQEIERAAKEEWLGSPSIMISAKEIGMNDPGPAIQQELDTSYPEPNRPEGLRILIDGLDEVALQNPGFIPQLRKWLRLQRRGDGPLLYRLAISCRWADWPEAEIKQLSSLWPDQGSKKLILCPLRRPDVVTTLKDRYGTEQAHVFWDQVHERHLQHVACWPQGLKGLMDGFEKSGCQTLPSSYAEAVQQQIESHCRLAEHSDDTLRWTKSVSGVEWRQRVAGRLAAAMIWSGKTSLSLQGAGVDAASVTTDELVHSEEEWEGRRRAIKLEDLDDVVRLTSLMKRLAGDRRWMFQSQIYQEWLAADWLAAQKIDPDRLQSLFGVISDSGWRVFPALKPVAAWLAAKSGSFRALLLENDPLVLLRLDATRLPEQDRAAIVEALLQATHRAGVVDPASVQAYLPSLLHSGLETQLGNCLRDETLHSAAKELAAEIASKVGLTSLVPLLWEIYPGVEGRLQIEIAEALYHLAGDEIYDEKWKAVLRGELPIDEHTNLLGAALEWLVVKGRRMPVRDVLEWLIPVRSFGIFGLYDMAAREMHQHLTVDDLPAVFAKLSQQPELLHSFSSGCEDLNSQAIRLAVENFDTPHVAKAFLAYWHACVRRHVSPHHRNNASWTPEELGFQDEGHRLAVASALIKCPQFETLTQRKWVPADDFLFLPSDIEWCLDQVLAASSADEEWRFALVARHYLWCMDLAGSHGTKLIQAWEKSPFLRDCLPKPVGHENVVEAILRTRQEADEERSREVAKSLRSSDQRETAFQKRLQDFTAKSYERHSKGDLVWPDVYRLLSARCHGMGSHGVTFGPEACIAADEEWMREAARQYLMKCPFEGDDDQYGIPGLFAFAVCFQEANQPGPVRDAVAARWLPALLDTMGRVGLENADIGMSRQNLARLFPAEFAQALGSLWRGRYARQGSLTGLHSYKDFWTPAMTAEIRDILLQEPLQSEGFLNAIRFLSEVSSSDAVAIVENRLSQLTEASPTDAAAAAVVGAAAIFLKGVLGTEVKRFYSDLPLMKKALSAAVSVLSHTEVRMDFSGWPGSALEDLANVVWKAFPHMKHRATGSHGLVQRVTAMDYLEDFRGHLHSKARRLGLHVEIPAAETHDTPAEARERRRSIAWNTYFTSQGEVAKQWQFMPAQRFFKMVDQPSARLARNNDELMEATILSLKRWEKSLDKNWDQLWDLNPPAARPEERIAQIMRDWLKADLNVIAEREVELHTEDKTDILIQTPSNIPGVPALTVVVELKKVRKGNAKERRLAMKEQLLDRYLARRPDEGWTHGLYALAWTPQPGSWDDAETALEDTRKTLAAQATALSEPPVTLKSLVLDARFRGKLPTKAKTINKPK